jgi:hypothetical protein
MGVIILSFYDNSLQNDLTTWLEFMDHAGDAFNSCFMSNMVTQAMKFSNPYEKILITQSFQVNN